MRKLWLVVVAALSVAFPAGIAVAGEEGTLVVLPASGTLDTPLDVVTSGICTRGVTFVVAVRGEGIDPVTSGNAVGNTELAVLEPSIYPGRYSVPLSRSLREFFVGNGIGTPKGEYDLVFACRNRLDMQDLQTFTGTVRIKGDTFTALDTAGMALEDLLASDPAPANDVSGAASASGETTEPAPGQSGEQSGEQSPNESVGQSEGQAVEPAEELGTAGETSAGDASNQPLADEVDVAQPESEAVSAVDRSANSDETWRIALIALGAVLLLGAAYMWWSARKARS